MYCALPIRLLILTNVTIISCRPFHSLSFSIFNKADKIKKLAIFFVFAKLSSYGKKQFPIIDLTWRKALNLFPDELTLITPPGKLTIMVENLEESRK